MSKITLFNRLKSFVENKPVRILHAILILCFLVRVSYQVFFITYYQFYDPYRHPRDPTFVDGSEIIAQNLVQGRGYRDPQTQYPTARRAPVYPLFLAFIYRVFGINQKVALLFQSLFDTLTCLIIYHIALKLFKCRLTALLSASIWAVYLPGVLFVAKFYSEPLFTLLLSLFILLSIKSLQTPRIIYFIWTGVLLGLATLCRPVTQLFFGCGFVYYFIHFWRRKRTALSACIILFLSFSFTLAPWTVRNYMLFKRFIPVSTLLGYNLFLDHGLALGRDNYLAPVESKAYRDFEEKIENKYGRSRPLSEPEWGDIYMREAQKAIRTHPVRYLVLSLRHFTMLWFNLGVKGYGKLKEYAFFCLNAPLMLLAMLAITRFKGEWTRFSYPLLFLILYNTVVHMLLVTGIRFVIPVMPYIIILAAFALIKLSPFASPDNPS
jgi:4-amino-4-deoxy-L-arabinose transferase-like glycosyltransferase